MGVEIHLNWRHFQINETQIDSEFHSEDHAVFRRMLIISWTANTTKEQPTTTTTTKKSGKKKKNPMNLKKILKVQH